MIFFKSIFLIFGNFVFSNFDHSPILNGYGEVVGAIHSAYRGFENLCMATTNDQISSIRQQAMIKLLKDYKQYKLIIDMISI